MRKGLLGSLAALAASAGLAQAQPPNRLPAAVPSGPAAPAVVAPGRAAVGGADAVPIGPSLLDQPAAVTPDGSFMAGMQPQYGMDFGGSGEPQLNSECASGQLDYLLYFIRSQRSNFPLVTASTTAQLGALGPGSTTLFGMDNLNFNPFNGGRFIVDKWLDQNRRVGGEFIGMVTGTRSAGFVAGYGTQLIARPVIDANTGQQVSFLVAAPGFAQGGVGVTAISQFWGFEANGKLKCFVDETKELTVLAGFRYFDLAERLDISQRSIFVPGTSVFFYGLNVAPREIDVADSFQTRNNYYMAQFGLQGQWRHNRWSLQASGKIGIGDVHETSVINGNSTLILTPTSTPNTVPGGLLALSSNIGRVHNDWFVYAPEASLQLGYRLFHMTDVVVGYTFTYLSRAIRPGTQFDPVVNPAFLPTSQMYGFNNFGPNRPTPLMTQVDLWVQGFNFGVNIHF